VHGIRLGLLSTNVTVTLPGGKLEVTWEDERAPVWLAGPAETVFEGKLTLQ
jgi:diaminopimelate epimerase